MAPVTRFTATHPATTRQHGCNIIDESLHLCTIFAVCEPGVCTSAFGVEPPLRCSNKRIYVEFTRSLSPHAVTIPIIK